MKAIISFGLILMLLGCVFAINPDGNYTSPSLVDPVGMGALLVQEWSFGSIDLAFLIVSIIVAVVFTYYALPSSITAFGVMALATVFALGFNSIFAWGILLVGIVAISLMVVINLLLKTSY